MTIDKDIAALRRVMMNGDISHVYDQESQQAAKDLIKIGGDKAYEILADCLGYGWYGKGAYRVNIVAYEELERLRPHVYPTLIRVLGNPHPNTRMAAANLLYSLSPFFKKAVKGDLVDIRRLGEYEDPRTVSSLIEALRFYNDTQTYAGRNGEYGGHDWAFTAVMTLGQWGTLKAMEPLLEFRANLPLPSEPSFPNAGAFRRKVDEALQLLTAKSHAHSGANSDQSIRRGALLGDN